MTQPSYSSMPTVDKNLAVSTVHSFRQVDISINKETRLGELMEYNANRIARETIDKISDVLAAEWLEKNRGFVSSRATVLSEAKRKIIERLDPAEFNFFTRTDE